MRENIKSVGLILAIAIASVSLPIGIIGFGNQPTVNNYYTNNYYTTNNTTIIEPDEDGLISYPPIRDDFLFKLPPLIVRVNYTYNATSDFRLFLIRQQNHSQTTLKVDFYDLGLSHNALLGSKIQSFLHFLEQK